MKEKMLKIVCSDEGISFYSLEEWPVNELKAAAAAFAACVSNVCADEEISAEENAGQICECVMYAIEEGLLDDARVMDEGECQ